MMNERLLDTPIELYEMVGGAKENCRMRVTCPPKVRLEESNFWGAGQTSSDTPYKYLRRQLPLPFPAAFGSSLTMYLSE